MSEVVFSVQALNIDIDALKATVPSLEDTAFTCDVVCQLEMTIAAAKEMFRIQSDAVDINNETIEDVKYKLYYSADENVTDGVPNTVLGNSLFLTNTLCINTDNDDATYLNGTANALNKSVSDDYLRYLAYRCFNTHLGVDLFNNETEVKEALDISARAELDTRLTSINNANGGEFLNATQCTSDEFATYSHPTYHIVNTMFNQVPERFYDLSDNFISGTQDNSGTQNAIFSVPFAENDIIQFKLTVSPAADQHAVVNKANNAAISLGDRTYRVRIKLVETLSQ